MANVKVLLGFKHKPDAALNTFAATVLTKLTANADFSGIKQLVETNLNGASNAFNAALLEQKTGGRPATALKNERRRELIALLDKVARNVSLIAEGDESRILATGFDAGANLQRPVTEILKGSIRSISRGESPCEVDLEVERLDGANLYAAEWSADNGQVWHNGTYSSKRRFSVLTTAAKTDTLFRVRGLGRKERQGPWSEPVSIYVV